MIADWLKQDATAARFVELLGMSWDQAAEASERVAIQVESGMPEAHAVLACEAQWWNKERI